MKRPNFPEIRIGSPLFHFAEVTSTNDIVKTLASKGFPEGTTVAADRQTKGRGRLGRMWQSPDGENILVSILLKPKIIPSNAPFLTMVAAVATFDTIRKFVKTGVHIKWPNDIYIGSRKAAGILCELNTRGQTIDSLVIGIGINLNSDLSNFSQDLKRKTTSISLESGKDADKGKALELLFSRLDYYYSLFIKNDRFRILRLVNANLYRKGLLSEIETPNGRLKAKIVKINDKGHLTIITKSKLLTLNSAEIIA